MITNTRNALPTARQLEFAATSRRWASAFRRWARRLALARGVLSVVVVSWLLDRASGHFEQLGLRLTVEGLVLPGLLGVAYVVGGLAFTRRPWARSLLAATAAADITLTLVLATLDGTSVQWLSAWWAIAILLGCEKSE